MYKYRVTATCFFEVKYKNEKKKISQKAINDLFDNFNSDTLEEYFYYGATDHTLKHTHESSIKFNIAKKKYVIKYNMISHLNNEMNKFQSMFSDESSFDLNEIFCVNSIEGDDFFENSNIKSIEVKNISLKYIKSKSDSVI